MVDLQTSPSTTSAPEPAIAGRSDAARRMTSIWIATTGVFFVVLALFGLVMRLIQSQNVLDDRWYYAIVTLHGAGMIAITLMGLASVLSWVIRDRLVMSTKISVATYVMTMSAIVLVLISTMIGRFGPGWTFLYPLPTNPGPAGTGGWSPGWAYPYYIAVALVCLSFALWGFDVLRAGIRAFGNPGRMFGFDIVSGRTKPTDAGATNPSIVAAGIMALEAILTAIPGTIIIVMLLAHGIDPKFDVPVLFSKNLIYFVGHMLANFSIYLGAGIMYAVLPKYAGRAWPAAKSTIIAWWCITLTIIFPYFHHLYMDFAQPAALDVVGNVASYASALPSAVVTIFGAVLIVYRSGIRWSPAPLFLYAAMVGWAIGGVGALLDSTPAINETMHNTLWVPAHFHTYMALGAVLFLLGGVYHYAEQLTGKTPNLRLGGISSIFILLGGWIVVLTFFVSGAMSVVRRYAYVPDPARYRNGATVGLVGASIAAVGLLLIAGDLLRVYVPGFGRRSEKS
ncbi:MAG: cbb3-type cytochrome c oxidase subunit I [Actinobacteria bacterium]|nr:cbb3-type cytochrome c oxidase subunit I [Actinomycetota bacterium]